MIDLSDINHGKCVWQLMVTVKQLPKQHSLCSYIDFRLNVKNLFSMGMKVPTIIQHAQEALQQGHCVVIGLQTTGEVSF